MLSEKYTNTKNVFSSSHIFLARYLSRSKCEKN